MDSKRIQLHQRLLLQPEGFCGEEQGQFAGSKLFGVSSAKSLQHFVSHERGKESELQHKVLALSCPKWQTKAIELENKQTAVYHTYAIVRGSIKARAHQYPILISQQVRHISAEYQALLRLKLHQKRQLW